MDNDIISKASSWFSRDIDYNGMSKPEEIFSGKDKSFLV